MVVMIIIAGVLVGGLLFWLITYSLRLYAEQHTRRTLEGKLFPEGQTQKEQIIESLDIITKRKYSQDQLLDYFLKIKGLQAFSLTNPENFCMRRFLQSPTMLKLNYFEQIKFYETFLHYPNLVRSDINQDFLKHQYLKTHRRRLA